MLQLKPPEKPASGSRTPNGAWQSFGDDWNLRSPEN